MNLLIDWAQFSSCSLVEQEKTGLMMLFPNKSAFCSEKGKPGLRELQRQAEKRSNHKRSGTTKRFLAELGSLFIEECRQLGTGIKGDELFKTPSFRCGLHF